jgi:hypothetical protein
MPTKTEQSDLNLAVYGGSGDAKRIVIAPTNGGARASVVTFSEGAGSRTMFPFYGCDRLALFQAEFRGGLGSLMGMSNGRRADSSPSWVFFFDAGQAWSNGDWNGTARPELPALYDAGIGLLLGDLGIYWAHPFGELEGESTLTLRLGRRF